MHRKTLFFTVLSLALLWLALLLLTRFDGGLVAIGLLGALWASANA